jgi:putative copper resistance protein D
VLSALAAADALTWAAICVKALVYATTLVSLGSVLCLVSLRSLPASEQRALRQTAIFCAVAAALLSVLRLPLRASFLMGGTWQGAVDPMLLSMVAESPLGVSIALRLVGLGLICALAVPGASGRWLAVLGTCVVAASFAFRGHALGDPRLVLGGLITIHILGLAFWVGAFAPLYRLARGGGDMAGTLAHEFGQKAVWVVGALSLAGGATLWVLTGNLLTALFTPYGQFFMVKLGLFLAVFGLAAWNKLRLTPALERVDAGAGMKLRRSIQLEAALIGAILLTTATLTTISAPAA